LKILEAFLVKNICEKIKSNKNDVRARVLRTSLLRR